MARTFPLPIQEAVRDLLADLFGRGVAVTKSAPEPLDDDDVATVAHFTRDDGTVAAVAVGDVNFSNRAGAALVMVPATAAEEAIRRGELPDNLVENYYEVVNIASRLVNSASTPHVLLKALYTVPGELPKDVVDLMAKPGGQRAFDCTIEGYGDGRYTLYVA